MATDPNVQQTTPPGLNPAQISPQALATLFPAQAPATPPIVPPQVSGGMEEYANLSKEQVAQLLNTPAAQEAARARAAGPGFAQQVSETPLPQMGPHIQHGAGFLHNLGQALQMASMATPAGREVFGPSGPVYGPGIAKYRATQAGLMGQKEASEKEAEEAGKEVQSLAGVAGRTIYGGSRVEAEKMSAEQRAQDVLSQRMTALDRIASTKGIADKRNATLIELANIRADVERDISAAGNVTKEEVARILANSAQTIINTKLANDPSLWGDVKRIFGVSTVEAPGGASPVEGRAPLAPRTPAKTPANSAAPARPKGVPGDYTWNPQVRRWQPPK